MFGFFGDGVPDSCKVSLDSFIDPPVAPSPLVTALAIDGVADGDEYNKLMLVEEYDLACDESGWVWVTLGAGDINDDELVRSLIIEYLLFGCGGSTAIGCCFSL